MTVPSIYKIMEMVARNQRMMVPRNVLRDKAWELHCAFVLNGGDFHALSREMDRVLSDVEYTWGRLVSAPYFWLGADAA